MLVIYLSPIKYLCRAYRETMCELMFLSDLYVYVSCVSEAN
jgi:hypothetical protein